jgi:hypothetical protein
LDGIVEMALEWLLKGRQGASVSAVADTQPALVLYQLRETVGAPAFAPYAVMNEEQVIKMWSQPRNYRAWLPL